MSISKIFIQTLFVFLKIKVRKHIEQNLHPVARVMSGVGRGSAGGESKTSTWGFAMARSSFYLLFSHVKFCEIYNVIK